MQRTETMSKRTGPTRIPLFGSRIPIPGQTPTEPVRIVVAAVQSSKQFREITRKDIGKKVRVAEKEGVLRFVGNVHFTQGVWCGIELPNASGKNDGCVRGVRYFACPDSRGLMAPLCKVLLVDDTGYDDEEDTASGPHSMLFGIKDGYIAKDLQRIDLNSTYINESENKVTLIDNADDLSKRKCEEGIPVLKSLIRSDTYETLDDLNLHRETQSSSAKILVRAETYVKPEEEPACSSNNTLNASSTSSNACETFTVDNLTYLNENNFPDIVNSTRILAKLDRTNENFNSDNIEDNNQTVILSKASSKILDKQRSGRKASSSRNSSVEGSPRSVSESRTSDVGNSTRVLCKADCNSSTESNTTVIYGGNKNKRVTYTISESDKKKGRPNNTFVADCQLNDTVVKKFNDTFEKSPNVVGTKAKPFKFSSDGFVSPPVNSVILSHSTPIHNRSSTDPDVENSPRRRVRGSPAPFTTPFDEDGTKRDSLEFEESLGILTPEQMADVTGFAGSRTPSSENIGSLPNDLQNFTTKFQCEVKPSIELGSPNLVDASIQDNMSLGIIDENLLSNFTMKSDTTMNMELPLDSIDNQSKDYTITRLEQTPSPEDLPLDPTPIIESESKTEPTKSKTTSSFITSITSITSLDTGYQGDGEMSRPASRGPDHSPLTRRPLQRPQPRRPDPMTDSDFYTESDADNHEEHPLRGDRLARVIDGTLYGVDPQAAADIYVNNRENMDSSGIFTDIEGNTRADELSSADNENQNEIPDVSPSPSDTSSKTISNDSQNNAPALISRTPVKSEANNNNNSTNNNSQDMEKMDVTIELPTKRKSSTPSSPASSPASVRSPRHVPRDETAAKKYKMPKRNVTSKVKAVLESTNHQNKENNRTPPKKTVGRWDAVMNKISKNPSGDKTSFKEIKPKVFSNSPSTPNIRQNSTPTNKTRRTRTRAETTTTKSGTFESLHSSASDLSGASPAKRIGSTKKRAEVVRVTQVLTATKISPRSPHKNVITENKKNAGTGITANDVKSQSRRTIFSPKEKKQIPPAPVTNCGRATVKGGRASPGARPPQHNRAPVAPAPRTAEALAVLVQHLVFNLEAFRTPSLKKQVERSLLAAEEARFSYRQMEETLSKINLDHAMLIQEERMRYQKDITEIIEQHRNNISQLNHQHAESEQRLLTDHETVKQQLILSHNDQLLKLRAECNKLQKTHEQTLEILREENDSIREEIDEKNATIAKLEVFKRESEKLEKDYQVKEMNYKEQLNAVNEEIAHLKEENIRIMNFAAEGKENKLLIVLAEVESLRAVLELKQTEVADLRRALGEANQKAELLPSAVEKVSVLTARCEDLQSQLERKSGCEHQLLTDNKKLQESLKEEFNHSKRLIQHNEELQWKLKQNKEVVTRVLEQAEETAFNRSLLTSSFNERNNSNKHLERTMSFRERSLSNKSYSSQDGCNRSRKSKNSYDLDSEDISPPSSPKVKGVVEKSDSVSYVLEMEESPEMIANRIVRRSFRNSTPPKTTPTKSPANKRPRMKNSPLSLSASASAIVPSLTRSDLARSRSVSVRNGDIDNGSNHSDEVFMWHMQATSTPAHIHKYTNEKVCDGNSRSADSSLKFEHNIDLDDYNDDDIKLPTLPSEIGRKNDAQSLPVPKHLAGEAMVSESNSEDESTASSSSGQL